MFNEPQLRLRLLGLAFAALAGFGLGGCTVGVSAGPVPVATSYYSPMYYNGYVVYYDQLGQPIYYANGARYLVPRTYAHYGRLRLHYRRHRRVYHRWYRARGRRLRRRHYRRGGRVHRRNRRTGRRHRRKGHRRVRRRHRR